MGRPGAIDYSLPPGHPWCFEVDELVPVSRYWLGGYESAEQCALDYGNLGAAHRCCNQWRGNRTVDEVMRIAEERRGAGAREDAGHDPVTSRDWRRRS
jgi:hypothetical protein